MNNTIRTTSGKRIEVSEIKAGDKVKITNRKGIAGADYCLAETDVHEVALVNENGFIELENGYDYERGVRFTIIPNEFRFIEIIDNESITEMNNDSNSEEVTQPKERKFNQGDKVLTLSGSTGVVKGYSDNGNCLVSITNQEGENSVYNFLEEDLTVYSEEPKARRVNSFESETKDIVDELHETLVRKNADYGNSFTKSYEKWGIVSAIIRMEDKFNRLNQLYDKDSSEVNESLYDTVLDLAGYAILTARELKKADTNERG